MKICYLCSDPGIPVFGRKGCSAHVRETCLALASLGHEVRLVCSNAEGDEFGKDLIDRVEVERFHSRRLGFELRRILVDRKIYRAAEQLIRQWNPDALYERYSLYATSGIRLAHQYDIAHILEVNAMLSTEQADRINLPILAERYERRIFRKSRHIVAVSEPLRDQVEQVCGSAANTSTAGMAVDLKRFHPGIDRSEKRKKLGIENSFVLGYVGTLTGWHGIKYLYDLADRLKESEIPDFRILIVGGNERRVDSNREKVIKRGLVDHLSFIGDVPHTEVPSYIRAMDVALIPDTTIWSSPTKLYEYQGCGIPTLAPSYPAIETAMTDGVEGRIFQPRDVEDLAKAACQLYRDPELRAQMGANARVRAETGHSWEHQARQITKIFEEEIANRTSPSPSTATSAPIAPRENGAASPAAKSPAGTGLKILYICSDPGVPVFGRKGCSTHVRETCLVLRDLGHDVRLVCSNAEGDAAGRDELNVLSVEAFRSKKLGFDLRHALVDRRIEKNARDLIEHWKPDVIYERYSLYGKAGYNIAKAYGLPHVLEVNALMTDEQSDRIRFGGIARAVERKILQQARHIIVVSDPLRDQIGEIRGSKGNISRIPMGVDLEKFNDTIDATATRAELGLTDKYVIGYVGTLTGWHGIKLLYGLAAKLKEMDVKDFQILVVGGDPRRLANHRRRVSQEGLEGTIHFMGPVAHSEVPRYIRSMDVTLIPDTTYWSAPSKMFEYQGCGVPIVAPRYPAVEGAMEDGVEGLIFEPRNVEAMAEAVAELYAHPERRKQMGREARARAEREHSWRSVGEKVAAIFENQRGDLSVAGRPG